MRVLLLVLASAAFAAAESHPSWWTYASPDATALVGIQWENLRKSPLADIVGTKLSSTGSLGFPDLDCLRQARQIVLSAPALLAIESGVFPATVLREQALRAGLRNIRYRGVALWIPSQASRPGVIPMSVAEMSEQLVLVGARKTLEAAIDNSLAETARRYSPLLARAARFSQTADLWVVSTQLPDPLASLFVPLEVDAQGFEGAMRVTDELDAQALDAQALDAQALDAQAWIDAGSERGATAIADQIRRGVHGVQVTSGSTRVAVSLQLTHDQLVAALNPQPRNPPATETASVALPIPPQPPPALTSPLTSQVNAKPATVSSIPIPAPIPAPTPTPGPQVIRIIGLDEGPKEIPFPDAPIHKP